jgi:hypothetical protein
VGPRADLDKCGKSRPPPGFDPRDRAARSQSLYRLSYPGPSAQTTKTHKRTEMKLYSFFTTALNGSEWSTSRPGRFTCGKEPQYPLCSRLGGPQGLSGRFGGAINSRAPIGVRISDLPSRSESYAN